jgi:hypothetical protein
LLRKAVAPEGLDAGASTLRACAITPKTRFRRVQKPTRSPNRKSSPAKSLPGFKSAIYKTECEISGLTLSHASLGGGEPIGKTRFGPAGR